MTTTLRCLPILVIAFVFTNNTFAAELELQKGDHVNLEVDILGKYVARYLAKIAPEVGS